MEKKVEENSEQKLPNTDQTKVTYFQRIKKNLSEIGKTIKTTLGKKRNNFTCFLETTPTLYLLIGSVIMIVSCGAIFIYFPKFWVKGKLNFTPEFQFPVLKNPPSISDMFPRLKQKDGLIFSHPVVKTIENELVPVNLKLLETAAYAIEQTKLESAITEKFLQEFAQNVTLFPENLITVNPLTSTVPNIENAMKFKKELKIKSVRNAIYDEIMRRKKYISLEDIKNVHKLNESIPENVKEILVEVTKKGMEKIKN